MFIPLVYVFALAIIHAVKYEVVLVKIFLGIHGLQKEWKIKSL